MQISCFLQVIVHTAVRTKVPLKKKVRGERKKKSSSKAPALPQKENILPNSLANAATSPTLPISILPGLKASSSKRQQKSSTDSPKKLLRKKKKQRPSSEESTPKKEALEVTPAKPSRKPKKKSKHKEVIDYSNAENHTNTFGKVQKWLLESPIVSSAASQIEHASKISNIVSKSQSTPEHLTNMQRSPSNTKVKSTNNLNDKVRLQVVQAAVQVLIEVLKERSECKDESDWHRQERAQRPQRAPAQLSRGSEEIETDGSAHPLCHR
jgi:disintegrin and metalloproteinase domain-containing protein 10